MGEIKTNLMTAAGETGGKSRHDDAHHSEEGINQEPVSAEDGMTHKPDCLSPLNDGSRCSVSLQSHLGTKLSILTFPSFVRSLLNGDQPSLLMINWDTGQFASFLNLQRPYKILMDLNNLSKIAFQLGALRNTTYCNIFPMCSWLCIAVS